MKKLIILSIFSIVLLSNVIGQLHINWQNCLGGSLNDDAQDVYLIDDDIYIVGTTFSNDGDISFTHGGGDAWLVKTDDTGNLIWEKCFGGTQSDAFYRVFQSQTESSLFLVGCTTSDDGDISYDPYPESLDYWIVKTDLSGNIIWDRIVGGNGLDQVTTGLATSDGGIIALGYTGASDGDVGINYGYYDWWLIKLDEDSNTEWEISIGDLDFDFPEAIIQTNDGGYLVGGTSIYHGEGNTQCVPYNDYYAEATIFKMDANGNEEWQQCYGGSDHDLLSGILELNDGYLLSCNGKSNDGDLEGSGWHGGSDIWVIRTDSIGNIIWQKCYGGSEGEFARNIFQTIDGNFILFGQTYSFNGDVVGNPSLDSNRPSIWVICIDENGELLWQQCIGGVAKEQIEFGVKQKNDNTYIVAGTMNYGPSHDVECTNTTAPRTNFWLFEAEDTTVGTSESIDTAEKVSVFPNPSKGQITFQLPVFENDINIQLRDISGKLIETRQISKRQSKYVYDCDNLPNGIYIYNLYNENVNFAGKFIISK